MLTLTHDMDKRMKDRREIWNIFQRLCQNIIGKYQKEKENCSDNNNSNSKTNKKCQVKVTNS